MPAGRWQSAADAPRCHRQARTCCAGSQLGMGMCSICPCSADHASRLTPCARHRAEVARPALAFTEDAVTFAHTWAPGVAPAQMARPLGVTNASALPLDVRLRTTPPFGLSAVAMRLEAGDSAIVTVTCDAALGCGLPAFFNAYDGKGHSDQGMCPFAWAGSILARTLCTGLL